MSDKYKRSIAKTITWRCIATGTTMTLVYLFTHEAALSVLLGGLEATSKMIFYYIHERAWDNVKWGRLSMSAQK